MMSLDLALVGNGTLGALVSREGEVVWMCVPRFDGDPVFCSLLSGAAETAENGAFAVEMVDAVRTEQQYIADTPVLVTRCFDASGGGIEVTDFAPRFLRGGKPFIPAMLVRKIVSISGQPTIRVRLRPMQQYGAAAIAPLAGPNDHLNYIGEHVSLRLTTDAPIDEIVAEAPFALDRVLTLILGPDEDIQGGPAQAGTQFLERTVAWWREWVDSLTISPEWRDAVVRAAITLKLNAVEESGAIIAAMTTSIPEAPDSGRNWDYRYCWLRDAYFVVAALQRLGDSATTQRYVDFLTGIATAAGREGLPPLYNIAGGPVPDEREAVHLPGYRGMGPVRIGNEARVQRQHDVYGEAILAARPLFFNDSLDDRTAAELFLELEPLGEHAANLFDKPDAGLWELRGVERVHTFSSVMCWAACDGLADIADCLHLSDRATLWRDRAHNIHEIVSRRAWNDHLGAFTAAMDGDTLDASLLLMHPLGFIRADDPRFQSTVRAIGRDLRRGDFIYRYVDEDDFGKPENAFLVCTFWYIDALAAIGEHEEARRLFEHVLSCRNQHGLLAEDIDPNTREQWGNFVQTYSMAGIIDSAIRLTGEAS
jgi:GH15 family glucan-1,4-alpha-glucosidase